MPDSGHAIWWVLLVVLTAGTVCTQDSTDCGDNLRQQSGVITSPEYPGNYPNNKNCYWTITAGDKEIIDLRFSRLDLDGVVSDISWVSETCPDYVRVYDGDSVNSPLIATMCRIKTVSELAKIIIRSTKNKLHIVFVSDYQGQRPGFVASYWAHECPEFTYGLETCNRTCECDTENTASCNNTNGECKCKNGWTSHDCSQDVNECLNPRVEPCPYNYMECVNTIGGFECVCRAGLTENANGECEVEPTATCQDGNSCSHLCVNIETQGQRAQQHCYCPDNMKLVGDFCEACSNVAFGKDCRLSCQCVPQNTESCDITTGECICSQGWTLSDCSKDIDECTELYGRVCLGPGELCVNTLGGYQCNCRSGYERLSNGSCVSLGCDFTFTNSSGVIQSPNYPNDAYDDIICTWTITTRVQGETISVNFTDLYVGYNYNQYRDYCYGGALEVRDGSDSSAPLLGQYCGYYSNTGSVRSSGNTMYLILRTSRSYSKRFIGTYSAGIYQVFASKITVPSSNITSPGYPVGYTSNVFATWTITVATGNIVTLSFTDYDLEECGRDYVEVYDGSHPGAACIGRFCGSTFPRQISSTERSMYIIYSSEGNTRERGCNGSYVTDACKCNRYNTASCKSPTGPCVCKAGYTGAFCDYDIDECQTNPCPEHSTCFNTHGSYYCYCWNGTQIQPAGVCEDWSKTLTDQSGDIQSQGYPVNYLNNVNYTWIIIGKPNTVVSLRFSDFDVETLGSCYTDFVEVYDVIGASNRLIGQYCGTNIPGLLRTTDKLMHINFRTDAYRYYRTYKGFKATYYTHVCPLFMYGEETCSSPCSCAYDTTRVCDNTNGACFCKPGWVGRACSQDLDECRNPGVCPSNSDCINEVGTYTCQCHSGYVKDSTTGQCKESSRCSVEMKQKCSHLCDVDETTQEEICFCPDGLVLLSDNVTCVVSLYPHGTEAADHVAYGRTNTGIATNAGFFQFSSLVPIGSSVQMVASVQYNGVIVFNAAKVTGIPDVKRTQMAKQKLIAPFWTEQKNSGEGEVFYHVYEKCGASVFSEPEPKITSSPKEKEVLARVVRDITKFYNLPGFEVSVVLVATWKGVQPKGCIGNFTNTFQVILVSGHLPGTDRTYLQDEEKCYAIFIYKDGDGICKPGQPFEVGIVSDSVINTLQVDKNAPKLTHFVGNTGYKGMVTFEVGKLQSASIMCQRYLCKHAELISNQHFQSEVQELYQCPCSLTNLGLQWEFVKDEGNTKCFAISAVAKRRLLRNNQRNRLCCYSWTPPKSNSWEDWQESWLAGSFIPSGHILISDPWPWSNSFGNPYTYENAEENMQARTWCCEKSPYKFCNRFYKIFGDPECTRHPIFVPASALGDPHIVTLDNHTYSMNGIGEYVMVHAPTCTLQARTERVEINGTLSNGTVFTGFAAQEGDSARFQVQLATTNTTMVILVNGMDFTNKFYREPTFSWSTPSMSVIRRNEDNRVTVAVTLPCGVSFKVHVGVNSLQIDLEVDNSLQNKTKGLLGNYNGDPSDDFQLPNGTVLPSNITERQIFEHFAKAYMVTDDTSVFIYEKGESTKDYQHPEYVPMFLDEADPHLLAEARAFCGDGNTACILDYIATGNKDFAKNTKDKKEIIDLTRQILKNNPPTIRLVTNTDNNHWLVYEGKQSNVSVEATDDDNDDVTYELFGNIKDVVLDQRGIIKYTPNLKTPISLSIRAKDSKGAYSPILTITIIVCPQCNNHGNCNIDDAVAEEFFEGHFQILKCNCHPAYTGKNCESEVDACELIPCSMGQECIDLTAAEQGNSSVGYRCGLCPTGTTNVNGSCEGINECLDRTACDQECLDTYRSYECSCRPGFRLDPTDSRTCNDINECIERTSACQQECRNTIGNYTCTCRNGYTLSSDGTTCIIDVNISSICQQCEQVCSISNGQVSCDCNLGYKIDKNDPNRCSDVDECSDSPCSQICTNTRGKFECSCYTGYRLDVDGVSCLECDSFHFGDNCSSRCDCRGQGTCDRVLGCVCTNQWAGTNCDKDVNECADSHACAGGLVCVNEPGSFRCVCPNGYKIENDNCQDIDECSEYTNKCDQNLEDCDNNEGNYSCRCKEGLKRNEATGVCEDINECEYHIDGCKHICENGPGSYKCACHQGYRLAADRHNCEKYKEVCSLNCSHGCSLDDNGTPFCICPRGYHQVGVNACEDINECASASENPCDHKDRCINEEGYYTCSCEPGYKLENDGKSCVACSSGTWGVECNNSCACGKEAISCDPVIGCQCKPGCTGLRCTDVIDRCASGEVTCQPNEECVISGCSSVCQCRKGFTWVIDQCKDENECLNAGRHNCDQICTNTEGSFVCSCRPGYNYNSLSNTCQNENECLDSKLHNCDQVCTNTKEGFNCTCFPGYNYNSSSNTCNDVNECQQGNPCSQTCINTAGSYQCVCRAGQFLLADGVTCGTCPNGCPITCNCVTNNTYHCDKTIGQCNCKEGWTSADCSVDVNECLQNPCPNFRKCRNLNGSFECVCWNELQINSDGTCKDCNRTLTDRAGYLMSSNYPQSYSSNSYCSWTISINEPDALIVLSFLDYDVEGCPYDYVRIYNGVSPQGPLLGTTICDNWQKPLTSKGNNLHIVFTSDYSVNKKGFLASYTSYIPCKIKNCSHSCSVVLSNPRTEKCQCPEWMKLDQANDSKCISTNACNTTITEPEGYIVSSNYPEKYPFNFKCHWTIQGGYGSIVKLSFSDFTLETSFRCGYDSLAIHDGNSDSAPLIGRFCGKTLPPNITSLGSTLYIKFVTDGFFSYQGFKGMYTIQAK